MSIRRLTTAIAALALILTFNSSASAQSTAASSNPASTPAASTAVPQGGNHSLTLSGSFGYLFAETKGTDGNRTQMPAGWIVTAEALLDGRIAGVAEFAGSYQSEHMYRTNLFGGRYIFLKTGRVRPFAQLLAGTGRSSAVGDDVNAFTLQPGGGIDIDAFPQTMKWPHIGIRLQGDYDWRHRDTGNVNGYRFAASIVIR